MARRSWCGQRQGLVNLCGTPRSLPRWRRRRPPKPPLPQLIGTNAMSASRNIQARPRVRQLHGLLLGRCHLCGRRSREFLCPPCSNDLPVYRGPQHRVAGIAQINVAFAYDFPVRELILAMKFHSQPGIATLLGRAMRDRFPESTVADVCCPIPLSRPRLWQRGFNQSLLIAKALGVQHHVPIRAHWLRRKHREQRQSALNQRQRRANVRGLFDANERVAGLHVTLVDDVIATGSTLRAAARALRQAGAVRVDAWVCASANAPPQ